MNSGYRVALMAKAPLPGLAKTRLVPALGESGAAALAQRLLRHALQQARQSASQGVTLWCAPDLSHPAFEQARQQGACLAVQVAGDLGARMAAVFQTAWAQAEGPLLLMGADAPALDADMLNQTAAALGQRDAVFVPALDGGYALVGLRQDRPGLMQALFSAMVWSTPQVMADTRRRLAAGGFRWTEMPAIADIDEPADLAHLPASWAPP